MRELAFHQRKALSVFSFCCSESPHGERASTEDSVQDVTAEHHTSDDGRQCPVTLWLAGVTCSGGGREGGTLQLNPKWSLNRNCHLKHHMQHLMPKSKNSQINSKNSHRSHTLLKYPLFQGYVTVAAGLGTLGAV